MERFPFPDPVPFPEPGLPRLDLFPFCEWCDVNALEFGESLAPMEKLRKIMANG